MNNTGFVQINDFVNLLRINEIEIINSQGMNKIRWQKQIKEEFEWWKLVLLRSWTWLRMLRMHRPIPLSQQNNQFLHKFNLFSFLFFSFHFISFDPVQSNLIEFDLTINIVNVVQKVTPFDKSFLTLNSSFIRELINNFLRSIHDSDLVLDKLMIDWCMSWDTLSVTYTLLLFLPLLNE
jgi:hypothetical protein